MAAAVLLDDGVILTSIGLDNVNAAVNLCAETGALCQAFTLDRTVVASACVARAAEGVTVLAPCGVCQERLALWGPRVEVVVADPEAPAGWAMRTLEELNPYYWATQCTEDGKWPTTAEHSG